MSSSAALNDALAATTSPSPVSDRALTDSRLANVASRGRGPSADEDKQIKVVQHKKSGSTLAHKRSVKSITEEYEHLEENSIFLRPPSRSSRSSSPTSPAAQLSPPGSSLHHSLDVPQARNTPALHKRNSFLLPESSEGASPVDTPPRPRSLSSSSGTTLSRSPSIRLASGSYPSTLQPPSRKSSTSSIRSLPEPPPQLSQLADKASVAGPTKDDQLQVIESVVVMGTPTAHTSPNTASAQTEHPEPNVGQTNGSTSAADTIASEVANDDALYEDMDTVADLSSSHADSGLLSASDAVDFSKMTLAERREHSRRHSHVHSRNLSVFFPRPGTEAEAEADAAKAREQFEHGADTAAASTSYATGTMGSDAKVHRRGGSGNRPQITVSTDTATLSPRSASFAALTANQQRSSNSRLETPNQLGSDLSPSPTKSRRGHHHRHSVAMLDSGLSPVTSMHNGHAMERSTSSTSYFSETSHAAPFDATHDHHSHDHSHSHGHGHQVKRSLHARTVSALGHIPQASRPLLLFGISHFGLGAGLWMAGQEADSLSATGLGYLVVFDAMGILSSAISDWALEWEQHASDLRRRRGKPEGATMKRPYGMHRVSTLLHFVQTIYLLFASVYVLKESVEHALLEGGGSGDVQGGADGLMESASGHDHSHAHAEHSLGIVMPNLLLALSLAACVVSNIVMGNHARLVAACGISTAASGGSSGGPRHGRSGSVLMRPSELASPLLALLANPFSLTVLFFSSALLFAGLTMPSIQVAALDKVLAGLESVSMFYVAYPASVALGKVLLQTAPADASPNKQQLKRALKVVEQNPLVSYVPPPNVWQLTPPTSALVQADRGSGMLSGSSGSGARGVHFGSKSASLVVAVTVFLRAEASDEDCFEMTKWRATRSTADLEEGRKKKKCLNSSGGSSDTSCMV
ncbi:hypothetical protein PHSY_001792 [Pseudozyma hubeiensis SY62]|uniref:Cation efflux protein transmembrane domain-containing protein n=1 Tax=Pseudozyma hubeiensis (strain SY62) TaxID=1305764 RepID=R9NZK8_PSEHS|nr:hypothetical protein PHSY_001792 [Pseudozyma hubeiensis SY62]GAC94221.1 hypothetical protein PHSY_001792 [Pseudozyma hubeiensis SY62]